MIYHHNYKPRNKFFGSRSLFMGVELEVVCSHRYLENSADYVTRCLNNRVYIKNDSSIQPCGFEVVSHPMTLRQHKLTWDDKFFKLDTLSCNNSTGMHVHLNKKQFNKEQKEKFFEFIHSDENKQDLIGIAGRHNTEYAMFLNKDVLLRWGGSLLKDEVRWSKHIAATDCARKTVEVRIFAGTLDKSKFFTNLEFCDALHSYCNTEGDLYFNSFANFILNNNSTKYPHLKQYLSSLNRRAMSA